MTLIQKSVTIDAPVDKVLSILEDPERQSELNPNLKLLSHRPSPLGFFDTRWEYKMAGMKFSGESTVIAYEQGKRIVFEGKGGIDSHWEWTINAEARHDPGLAGAHLHDARLVSGRGFEQAGDRGAE